MLCALQVYVLLASGIGRVLQYATCVSTFLINAAMAAVKSDARGRELVEMNFWVLNLEPCLLCHRYHCYRRRFFLTTGCTCHDSITPMALLLTTTTSTMQHSISS